SAEAPHASSLGIYRRRLAGDSEQPSGRHVDLLPVAREHLLRACVRVDGSASEEEVLSDRIVAVVVLELARREEAQDDVGGPQVAGEGRDDGVATARDDEVGLLRQRV